MYYPSGSTVTLKDAGTTGSTGRTLAFAADDEKICSACRGRSFRVTASSGEETSGAIVVLPIHKVTNAETGQSAPTGQACHALMYRCNSCEHIDLYVQRMVENSSSASL